MAKNTTTGGVYIITSTSVAVKKKPSAASKKVGTLKKGAVIDTKPVSNEYVKISSVTNGKKYYTGTITNGYIEKLYLKKADNKQMAASTNTKAKGLENATQAEGTDAGADDIYVDDGLVVQYNKSLMSQEAYVQNLSQGLTITNLQGIMGMPHQFLPNTDLRLPIADGSSVFGFNDDGLGMTYSEKIISNMPLMFMTPGVPSFMSQFSNSQRKTILGNFLKYISDDDISTLFNDNSGKYYTLKYKYTEYFKYVNAMLRSASFFLGIQDEIINGKPLKEANWFYYNMDNGTHGDDDNGATYNNNGLRKFLGTYAGAIPFYVQAETRVSDTFSNSTAQSTLASSLDTLSDTARELNFLIGNVSGTLGAGELYDKYMSVDGLSENIENVKGQIDNFIGKGNILSNIVGKAQNLIAGGRMIFPEIWGDSSFSRSYSFSCKLISPSGDKLSIFLNILVPIYHLLAFVMPRASSGQSFYSPFMIRAYYKGIFNIDMGIMTDLNLEKGADGEWTPDGLPTVVDVSFTIKDLYDGIAMSTQDGENGLGIMSNIAELDYIANSCGINIDEPEVTRTISMYITLGLTAVTDTFTIDMFGGVTQFINQKIQNIFGKY